MTMKKLLLIFVFSTGITYAQWVPDRADYEVISEGNFSTSAHDMQTAISIAKSTLKFNGAKMHTLDFNKKDIDSPLVNFFHRDNEPSFVYITYIARSKTGYDIWFRYLPDEPISFEEEYVIIEYDGKH
jgi:hypothetical protein